MAEREVAHAVLYGANRSGTAIGWLTRWPVTREALVVHTPGEGDLLLVNFYNHVPNAKQVATEAEVRWAGRSAMETTIAELRRRGAQSAASAAFPPSRRISRAVIVASGWLVATIASAATEEGLAGAKRKLTLRAPAR